MSKMPVRIYVWDDYTWEPNETPDAVPYIRAVACETCRFNGKCQIQYEASIHPCEGGFSCALHTDLESE
jgi:hypothetical protein